MLVIKHEKVQAYILLYSLGDREMWVGVSEGGWGCGWGVEDVSERQSGMGVCVWDHSICCMLQLNSSQCDLVA